MSVVLLSSVSVLSPGPPFQRCVLYMYTHICSASVRFAPAALFTGGRWKPLMFSGQVVFCRDPVLGHPLLWSAGGCRFVRQGEISFLQILLKETVGPAGCVQVLPPFVKDRSAPPAIPEESLMCN